MKIAVIADIHANLFALRTVIADVEAWRPDRVVVLGDTVNRGPRPAECLALIQKKVAVEGWLLIRGNHEDYVISHDEPGAPRSGPAFDVHRASYWTYTHLNCQVSALRSMPLSRQIVDPDGKEVSFYHGSFLGLRDGIYPETPDGPLAEKIGLPARAAGSLPLGLFCVGHTHRPLVRKLAGTLVVNAGSAGLPFDFDTRPTYARLTWRGDGLTHTVDSSHGETGSWRAGIVRLDYDLAAAERDFYQSGYIDEAGPLVRLVLRELQTARSHLYTWALHYQDAAARGEISMEESVRRHLAMYDAG